MVAMIIAGTAQWGYPEGFSRPNNFPKISENIVFLIKSMIRAKACYTVINF